MAPGDTGPRDRVGMKCTLVEGVRDAVCMSKNLYIVWKLRNGAEVKSRGWHHPRIARSSPSENRKRI